jgi:hypothetical protein
MKRATLGSLALLLAGWSSDAAACALGAVYNLPIPFALYASGAGAALIVSFMIVAYVIRESSAVGGTARAAAGSPKYSYDLPNGIVRSMRWASMLGLLLTVTTGFIGSQNPLVNFNMTFFWIVFILGLTYLTALAGDVYALVNPWRSLCDWVERWRPGIFLGRLPYPKWLGYVPALIFYAGLIWTELFGQTSPRTLAIILLGYSGVSLGAAWLIGKEHWFRYGELFSVYFRLIGKMAPIDYEPHPLRARRGATYRIRFRKPFVGLLESNADHSSLLLFVIFMISSTAFDGAHDTVPWVGMFWKGIYPLLSSFIEKPYSFWVSTYYAWQSTMLLLLPFCYAGVYLILLSIARSLTGSVVPLHTLALRFAFTLVPIAFVYNMTHYYGELASQGLQVLRMVSDPFSAGWNLFGTRQWFTDPIVLDAGTVWHSQVALILCGHIVSVYLAHVEALRVFPRARHAILSQMPMLLLMVLLTTVGLWILSLPIDAGQASTPM